MAISAAERAGIYKKVAEDEGGWNIDVDGWAVYRGANARYNHTRNVALYKALTEATGVDCFVHHTGRTKREGQTYVDGNVPIFAKWKWNQMTTQMDNLTIPTYDFYWKAANAGNLNEMHVAGAIFECQWFADGCLLSAGKRIGCSNRACIVPKCNSEIAAGNIEQLLKNIIEGAVAYANKCFGAGSVTANEWARRISYWAGGLIDTRNSAWAFNNSSHTGGGSYSPSSGTASGTGTITYSVWASMGNWFLDHLGKSSGNTSSENPKAADPPPETA